MLIENKIIPSSRFVMIDNLLISRNYLPNLLSEKELKRLLQLYLHARDSCGDTISGHNHFKQVCPCSKNEYARIMERLDSMGLIKRDKYGIKITKTTVWMLPVYDQESDAFIVVIDAPKTGFIFGVHQVHFTVIPSEALKKALGLPQQRLRVLLKLYRHNNFDLFHGVDPNLIRLENDKWYVHSRLPYDLYMTHDDFITEMEELIQEGFVLVQQAETFEEEFDLETRLRIKGGDSMGIIVPKWQWRKDDGNSRKWHEKRKTS